MTTPLPKATDDVRRLCDIIGPEATLALVEAWGGNRVYVAADPVSAPDAAGITATIGLDAAKRLAEEYGRSWIKVPLGRTWRILVYRSRGLSYREIARKTGCTEGTVWSTLSRHRMTAHQFELFPRESA